MSDPHKPLSDRPAARARVRVVWCRDAGTAAVPCPRCGAHVHRGETVCANCGLGVPLLAEMMEWGPRLYNEALLLARRGDFDRARRSLLRARPLLPDRPEPYTLLAKLDLYAGEAERAYGWMDEARELGLVDADACTRFREAADEWLKTRDASLWTKLRTRLRRDPGGDA